MDEKRLEALLEQATVDCYDEEEAFYYGLADLNFIAPDPVSAEWQAMYRYWADMNEEE